VHIVLMSHWALEADVVKALTEIDGLDVCTAPSMKIRILADDHE
jgi:hypothetical protein